MALLNSHMLFFVCNRVSTFFKASECAYLRESYSGQLEARQAQRAILNCMQKREQREVLKTAPVVHSGACQRQNHVSNRQKTAQIQMYRICRLLLSVQLCLNFIHNFQGAMQYKQYNTYHYIPVVAKSISTWALKIAEGTRTVN